MRTFTYFMGLAMVASAGMAVGCSDDAGDDVAETMAGAGGEAGSAGAAGMAGSGGMAGDNSGGMGGMPMTGEAGAPMGGGAGMANMAGAGGMDMGGGSTDEDAGVGDDAGAEPEGVDSGVEGADAGDEVIAESVLFSDLYQPIFSRCSACHAGSYGAAEDDAYNSVLGNLDTVVNRLNGVGNTMPLGCGNQQNPCLTDDELEDVDAWVAAGTPR